MLGMELKNRLGDRANELAMNANQKEEHNIRPSRLYRENQD